MEQESHSTTNGEKTVDPQEEARRRSVSSLLGGVAQVSGVITVVVGTVYGLGMVTLVLPISTNYQTSLTTAWYMVSLVPKTVVAGYGVKSLIWPSLFTVLPIAFIVVMILMLASLMRVGVLREAHRTGAKGGDLTRGVLRMTAVFGVYSIVLGGVLFVIDSLLQEINSAISDYHVLAASLAYGVFALWCLLALSLRTLQVATYARALVKRKAFFRESIRSIGSVRVALYLALYVGLASAAISGLQLLVLFWDAQWGQAGQVLWDVWGAVLLALLCLAPMALMLLVVDRTLPTDMLDSLRPVFRMLGIGLRILLNVMLIFTTLIIIAWFFADQIVYVSRQQLGQKLMSGALQDTLLDVGVSAFFVFACLSIGVLLLWLISKAIPPAMLGVSRSILVTILAVVVVCDTLVFSAAFNSMPFVADEQLVSAGSVLIVTVIPLLVLSVAVVPLLALRGVLYARRMTRNMNRAAWRHVLVRRINRLRSTLANVPLGMIRYAGVYFVVFYLILAVTFLYGIYFVLPLIHKVESISIVDELLIWLWIVGGTVSGLLLYFKGLSFYDKETFLLAKGLRSFLVGFRQAVLPSSIRWRGFLLSLGGAYIFSVATAFLYITGLQEPPLPQVTVLQGENDLQSQTSGSVGGNMQSTTDYLLAHTEGYWYLMDGREGSVLAIPDRDDYAVQVDPSYVEVMDELGALKVAVPVEWNERNWDVPANRPANPPSVETSKLVVSTDTDSFGRGYAQEGIFVQAYSAQEWTERWHSPVGHSAVEKVLDLRQETISEHCKYQDRTDYVVETKGYTGQIARSSGCTKRGGTVTVLAAMPEDRSFMVVVELQLPQGVKGKEENILPSIGVKGDSLP